MSSSAEELRPAWASNLRTAFVLVAMAIVAVGLCGGIAYASWPHAAPSRRTNTKSTMLTVQQALVVFQAGHEEDCPASVDDLVTQKLLTKPPIDAWQQPLRFVCPGAHTPDGADVVSAGPDKQFDTQDDIKSWEL